MSNRLIALGTLTAMTLLAAGCVEERVVHHRPVVVQQPVQREVIVERPVIQREYVEVVAPRAPPQREVELLPAARPGYVWAHGYWRWNGRAYVGVPGHWEVVRRGYRYVHPHYEQRNDGWHLNLGVWVNG